MSRDSHLHADGVALRRGSGSIPQERRVQGRVPRDAQFQHELVPLPPAKASARERKHRCKIWGRCSPLLSAPPAYLRRVLHEREVSHEQGGGVCEHLRHGGLVGLGEACLVEQQRLPGRIGGGCTLQLDLVTVLVREVWGGRA